MDSMFFTICGLIVVGISWCLNGVILGRAPKDGLNESLIIFTGAICAVLCGIVVSLSTGAISNASLPVTLRTLAFYFAGGIFNFFGLQSMAQGMRRGPNGIIWGIMQSALVFPFTIGIVVFGTEPTVWRLVGIVSLLVGLAFYAMAKESSREKGRPHKGSWRFYAFLSFALVSIQQTLTSTPSYFPEARSVSSVLRSVALSFGDFVGFLLLFAFRILRNGSIAIPFRENYHRLRFWAYIFVLQFFAILFAYTLLYPGMDKMAEHGAGAVSYPLMVASCIIAFTVYSFAVLKEKPTFKQILALIFCLIGFAGMCIQ